MRVGIVAQRDNDRAAYLAADVAEMLAEESETSRFDRETATAIDREATPVEEFDDCDLVVSIGGDGTFLYAARNADTTPVLGVNLGEVGFLNAVAPEDAVTTVREEVRRYREEGAVRFRTVPRLVGRLPPAPGGGGDGDPDAARTLAPALNEVVVQGPQRGRGQGINVEVRVDGSLYAATHADGVLVATPTGSTAYNLSEGGPLVRPQAPVLLVTAMCPADAAPPLVCSLDVDVTIRIDGADAAYALSDGTAPHDLRPPATVEVSRAADPARVAGPAVEFFQALNKLE
jgi:NAD+ kinase